MPAAGWTPEMQFCSVLHPAGDPGQLNDVNASSQDACSDRQLCGSMQDLTVHGLQRKTTERSQFCGHCSSDEALTPDACFASLDQAFPSGLDPRTSTQILSGLAKERALHAALLAPSWHVRPFKTALGQGPG